MICASVFEKRETMDVSIGVLRLKKSQLIAIHCNGKWFHTGPFRHEDRVKAEIDRLKALFNGLGFKVEMVSI